MNRQANTPTILVVFGATGDLMARKIVPALFQLWREKKLPRRFEIVGYSRRPISDTEFQTMMAEALEKKLGKISKRLLEKFLPLFQYHQGTFEDAKGYQSLAGRLRAIDDAWGVCSNKLFYLSVPPEQYELIIRKLDASHLTDTCGTGKHGVHKGNHNVGGWSRIIIEKPFGKDLKTSERLDALLGKHFDEHQIYRIDHYLGKEMSQNILAFRFSNNLFEDLWDRKFIEKIEIRERETLGVETRGAFYDVTGALRDYGQNHILQLLALITMDRPKHMTVDGIRNERANILRTLKPLSPSQIRTLTFRAQYKGYQTIHGVAKGSQTETYFKSMVFLSHPKWRGVPIIMDSGKRMGRDQNEIMVTLRHPKPCLLCKPGNHTTNTITFEFEPNESIVISLWAKKPGLGMDVERRSFDFTYHQSSNIQYVEEYKKMLYDCIQGDQTLFVSTDEMKSMWQYTDPILNAWKRGVVPLVPYKPDTNEAVEKSTRIEKSLSSFRP